MRHLIAHGHRRIAFIGWLEYPAIAERYEGYRDALTESGLPCSPELVIGVEDNHLASGRAGARQLLEGAALPCTAVVAGTDLNAVGVMEVLQAAGLRVPEDVAVVGFDDADGRAARRSSADHAAHALRRVRPAGREPPPR